MYPSDPSIGFVIEQEYIEDLLSMILEALKLSSKRNVT